jgi:hypothetical protein
MPSLAWTCEAPEPGRRGAARPRWTAEIGPVRLVVREHHGYGLWVSWLEGPVGVKIERPTLHSIGEAIEAAEPWARETLERWRDLGELARVALAAWDGEP